MVARNAQTRRVKAPGFPKVLLRVDRRITNRYELTNGQGIAVL
jgi:hypothetical protein